jgi:hypothetical protein
MLFCTGYTANNNILKLLAQTTLHISSKRADLAFLPPDVINYNVSQNMKPALDISVMTMFSPCNRNTHQSKMLLILKCSKQKFNIILRTGYALYHNAL